MTVDVVLFRNLRFLKLSQVAYLHFFLKILKKILLYTNILCKLAELSQNVLWVISVFAPVKP